MKPISNIAYWIQYSTITCCWTSRKTSIQKSRKPTTCRLASPGDMYRKQVKKTYYSRLDLPRCRRNCFFWIGGHPVAHHPVATR